jgi:hypothetical protein
MKNKWERLPNIKPLYLEFTPMTIDIINMSLWRLINTNIRTKCEPILDIYLNIKLLCRLSGLF